MKNLPKIKNRSQKVKIFLEDFKAFINRGNVAELAIGVVIGGAFSKIVSSLVADIITPIIGVLLGGVNFSNLNITIPNIFGANTSSRIAYGLFIQNVIDFLIVAFSIFTVIHFLNKLNIVKTPLTAKQSDKSSNKPTDNSNKSPDDKPNKPSKTSNK